LSTTLQKKKKIQINIDIAKANRISNSYWILTILFTYLAQYIIYI
jgi:hypothetical protein